MTWARVLVVVLAATSAPAIELPDGFQATVVARDLQQPTAARFAPDGRLFILEKGGAVLLWTAEGGLAAEPLVVLPTCTRSEMGLLGLELDPDFARNGFLYLYGTHPPGGDPGRCEEGSPAGRENRLVRVTVAGDAIDPASLVVIFDGIATDGGNHDGGDVHVGPDGFLYLAPGDTGRGDFGDPGDATNPYARDVRRPEGKVLRMTLDGQPAPGNPFLGQGGAADFVFALGLRNPFRFTFDPQTGLLWAADVGQHTWEEIDVVRPGDDLGWPLCEGRAPTSTCPGDTVPPVHVYGHGDDDASITGGVFYDGELLDGVRGDYFFGDYVRGVIWRAELDAERTGFVGEPVVFARGARGPVHFTVGPDGALYHVAIAAGQVVRIGPTRAEPDDRCRRRLATAMRRLLRVVGAGVDRCVAAGRLGCAETQEIPVPPVAGKLARGLTRACGLPALAARCEDLGCACPDAEAAAACLAGEARELGQRLASEAYGSLAGACARAGSRATWRAAGGRLVATARCLGREAGGCLPLPVAPVRRLSACRDEVGPSCVALLCGSCQELDELAACLGGFAAGATDQLGERLFTDP
jgi:glucose/arabinose dehydrogenase